MRQLRLKGRRKRLGRYAVRPAVKGFNDTMRCCSMNPSLIGPVETLVVQQGAVNQLAVLFNQSEVYAVRSGLPGCLHPGFGLYPIAYGGTGVPPCITVLYLFSWLSLQVQNQCSEFGDERPISAVAYSPDGSLLASGAWSGLLKLWGAAGCEKQLTVRAHDNRITGVPPPFLPPTGRVAWQAGSGVYSQLEIRLCIAVFISSNCSVVHRSVTLHMWFARAAAALLACWAPCSRACTYV